MKLVCDLHIHSKYARATSPRSDLPTLDKWAQIKGVNVLGTGDFTHPAWFRELSEKLEPAEPGLYALRPTTNDQRPTTRFLLSVEVSLIYSKGGKVRKIHHIICVPLLKEASEISKQLAKVGRLDSDGRPIFGMSSEKLAEIVFGSSEKAMLIPAHIWTPWFAIFGSKSGFDSIEECFEKWTPKIFAIETGLSSDPVMNWMVSKLDNVAVTSYSDAHSPEKIMREATVLDCELNYEGIYNAIKSRDPKKFLHTIEFFPEEGKYHYDGHRACQFSIPPAETKKFRGVCPRCGRPLTIGVLNRVWALADRKEGEKPKTAIPFKNFIPLQEIIEQVKKSKGKAVQELYSALINAFGNELEIIENASFEQIKKPAGEEVAKAVIDVREGKVKIIPGYDGEYGKIELLGAPAKERQSKLF
ncbi:MAG: DNA helicase UvrD [Candidatus Portnoybacteria bacterium]|nr:DNA helicase UvrD [Candidatus Portnoybacteria bacterium]